VVRGETEEENRRHQEIAWQRVEQERRRDAERERQRQMEELKAKLKPEFKLLVEEMQRLRWNYLEREGQSYFGVMASVLVVIIFFQIFFVGFDRSSPFGEYFVWLVLGLVGFMIVSLLAQFAIVMNRNLRLKAEISEKWAKLEAAIGHEKPGPETAAPGEGEIAP
jgi:hypothetical protein